MDADGRNLERLRWNMPLKARPAWHPDGTKILFTRFEGLMVFDLETKIETQVFFRNFSTGGITVSGTLFGRRMENRLHSQSSMTGNTTSTSSTSMEANYFG